MEQYLIWMKSKNITINPFNKYSWEEEAFAEDSRGFIWPPRSYSCNFCNREFKSAQALGGHMNVHRRDRARLKQSLSSPHQIPSRVCASEPNHSLVNARRSQESILLSHDEFKVETNLNLGVSGNRSTDEAINCKRRKTAVLPLPLIVKAGSMGDVDLELRLGDSSTVK